jgi:ParB family chromosome partitioning protein
MLGEMNTSSAREEVNMEAASKRRALGRGLGALIPGASHDAARSDPQTLPIAAIRPNPMQPRQTFDEHAVAELADSIREKGILQPLLVRRIGENLFELIAGERRLRAAERVGLSRVPVTVRDVADDEMLELALVENIQRENLNPIEEARAYKRMSDDLGMTQQDISTRVGKERSTIANTLRLLQLPAKILAEIESGAISAGHARALVGVGSDNAKLALARRIVSQRLSVRQTERLAKSGTTSVSTVDPDLKQVEQGLIETWGTRIRIQTTKTGRGHIEIEYYSSEQLNGLIERLAKA